VPFPKTLAVGDRVCFHGWIGKKCVYLQTGLWPGFILMAGRFWPAGE